MGTSSIKYDNSTPTANFTIKQVRKIRAILKNRDKRLRYLNNKKSIVSKEIKLVKKTTVRSLAEKYKLQEQYVHLCIINKFIAPGKVTKKQLSEIKQSLKYKRERLDYLHLKLFKLRKEFSAIRRSNNINTMAEKYKVHKPTISRIKRR